LLSAPLVVVAPLHDKATEITYWYASKLMDKLHDEGIPYEPYTLENAIADVVRPRLQQPPRGLYFQLSHGDSDSLIGSNGKSVVNDYYAHLLKEWGVCVLACLSAQVLAYRSVREGARFYIGYCKVAYVAKQETWAEVLTYAMYLLAKGVDSITAYKEQLAFMQKITFQNFALNSFMQWNARYFVLHAPSKLKPPECPWWRSGKCTRECNWTWCKPQRDKCLEKLSVKECKPEPYCVVRGLNALLKRLKRRDG